MKISIWQQFSSNHRASVWVVSQFDFDLELCHSLLVMLFT